MKTYNLILLCYNINGRFRNITKLLGGQIVKKFNRILLIFLTLIIILTNYMTATYSAASDKSITVLFTHDTHDHFFPFNVYEDGEINSIGGFARLYSAIEKEREKDPNLILLDGGDFSMGTLFQTIFDTESPALRLMGQMGYDVTTFGNHEFDFRAEGLANSLNAAKRSLEPLPEIVSSNMIFPLDEEGKLTPSLNRLKNAMDRYGVKDYTILEKNGIRIGVFGVLGKDAASNAPMSEVEFSDIVDKSREMVDILKNTEKVDLIICLSHSGTWEDKSKSEDEILAKEVPEIDIIISGHTHTAHHDPIIVGDTIIGSYGRNGENLGVMKITQNKDGRWDLNRYRLEPIDDSFPLNEAMTNKIEVFKSLVQEQYLDKFGMEFDEVLAYTPFNFTPASQLGKEHKEDILGNLIGDSYIYATKKAEGRNYEPITAAVVPYGIIRGSFVEGEITVADVFEVSSLGIGPDKVSGYPLISVYLTGKELKTAAEVDASIQPIMDVAQLYISGLKYTFNPKRMIFNKVTDIHIENPDGSLEEIEDDKLYRVVAGLYSAQMLSVVGDKSFGLLSIVPKTKDGRPITDFEAQIIYDEDHELKEWIALAEYLKSFNWRNGLPQVSNVYKETQGRKIVDENSNIFAILKNPNRIAKIAYTIVLVIIILIILLIRFICKRRKRKRYMFARY